KSLVIIVIGIGAGKSILFILPALCFIGVIVIVIPLILLRDNLKDYCDKVGIKYIK
ncbi:uncharacterized protein K441DRAFT_598688, partial [Cenococcum geophilum 1.58]